MTGAEIVKSRIQAKIDAKGREAHMPQSRDRVRLECWQRAVEELIAEIFDTRGKV